MRLGLAAMGDGPIRPVAGALDSIATSNPKTPAGHLWLAEAYLFRDAMVQAAIALASSPAIRVATGIVNVYSRHPAVLAMGSATLAEEFGERFVLGLGPGNTPWMRSLGYNADRPFSDVAATLDFLRRLFAGQRATVEMSWIASDELRLGRGLTRDVPIVLAGGRSRILRLAGAEADGVLLPFVSAEPDELAPFVQTVREEVGTRSFPVGCVSHCFIAGDWLPESPQQELEHLAVAVSNEAQRSAPYVFEANDSEQLRALISRLDNAGLDEVAFVVTQSSVEHVARFVASALADQ